MKLFALVYKEHYEKFCELRTLDDSDTTLQLFLKEIGTPSLCADKPNRSVESNYVLYKSIPDGSCIRLRLPYEYVAVIHAKLFQVSREPLDKSRRGSSCVLI